MAIEDKVTKDAEADKQALRETFARAFPAWTDSQLDTAIQGR